MKKKGKALIVVAILLACGIKAGIVYIVVSDRFSKQ